MFGRAGIRLASLLLVAGAAAGALTAAPALAQFRGGFAFLQAVENRDGQTCRIVDVVEKPKPDIAPSNLAIVGRYLFTPAIFGCLERVELGVGGEIQLTDAIAQLLPLERVDAFRFRGTRFDCGTHLGLIEATVRYALDHELLSDAARALMQNALNEMGVVET